MFGRGVSIVMESGALLSGEAGKPTTTTIKDLLHFATKIQQRMGED